MILLYLLKFNIKYNFNAKYFKYTNSRHYSICDFLESIIMRSSGVHATLFNQSLAVKSKSLFTQILFEPLFEDVNSEPLKTLQITLIHHNLQNKAKFITSFSDRIHSFTKQIDKFNIIRRIFTSHQQYILFS